MLYTTDAHSLVWYFTEDPKLSKKALEAFDETVNEGSIIVPTIVLAEIMFIARKGRITLTFRQTLAKIETYENFEIAPLDISILEIADTLEVDLEMHDRLIVATALYFNSDLITKDNQIRDFKAINTIW
ncbi:MAG: PIN domain-containing protein [Proteobacteria bacterium]|nr:PIN domain-containing protein [Pseudomonadota bacterium]